MINIILVDDNSIFLKSIEKEIKDFFLNRDYIYKIYTFNEYNDDFFKISSIPLPNKLYLFDIETDLANGIDIARKIRKYEQDSDILFLTAHDTYEYKNMIVTSNVKSMGFIYKGNVKLQFHKKLEEFLNNIESSNTILFEDGPSSYAVSIKDIFYVTTDKVKRKTIIHTTSMDIELSLSLGEVENILLSKSNYFLKIHRSYIINIMRVISLNISKKSIVFSDNEQIHSISKKHKQNLLKIWSSYHNL